MKGYKLVTTGERGALRVEDSRALGVRAPLVAQTFQLRDPVVFAFAPLRRYLQEWWDSVRLRRTDSLPPPQLVRAYDASVKVLDGSLRWSVAARGGPVALAIWVARWVGWSFDGPN